MVATAANTAQPRRCDACGDWQDLIIRMVPTSTRNYRYLVMGLVKLRGVMMRVWVCQNEFCSAGPEDAGTIWPAPADPVRPEIVSAIRRLKAAGHRFFEWEKK